MTADEPPLLTAARQDAYGLLDQLLEAGENPNQTNKDGETALLLAAQRGFEKAVFRLLQAGADALKVGGDITRTVCSNALGFALKDGNQKIIQMLMNSIEFDTLEKICWYRGCGGNGFTSFLDKGLLTIVDISCQPSTIESLPPLFQAIYKDDFAAFKQLLEEGSDPHATLGNGLAPLHIALGFHRNAMFDLLLEYSVKLDQRDAPYYYSPLFVAVHTKNRHAYRKLIDLGAPDLPTGYNHTALFAAVYSGDMEVIQELIARGSDIKQYACHGCCTLVYTAARYGHVNVLKYLLSLGLHPDWDAEGNAYYSETLYGSQFTALSAAVKHGDVESVELLLNAGADPNRKSNGIPPIHFAMPSYRFVESETIDYHALIQRYLAIIDLLLAHGANIDLKADHNQIPALTQAYATEQKEIALHLVRCGAASDKKDKRGKFPYEYAR